MKKELLIPLSCALLLATTSSAAVILENFNYTNGDTLATPLNGGTGWTNSWTAVNAATGTVNNSSPLKSGGTYLTYQGTGGQTRSVYRVMDGTAVDFSGTHQISFTWRADNLTNFSNSSDRFEFYNATAAAPTGFDSTDGTNTSSYLFGLFGADRGSSTTGEFAVYNPSRSGSDDGDNFNESSYGNLGVVGDASSGSALSVVAGTTYEVVIDLRPDEKKWDLWISDGTNTAWSTGLNFWGDGTTQEQLAFGTRGNNGSDTRTASLDSISVVPEPAATQLLLGLAALGGLMLLRRKSR